MNKQLLSQAIATTHLDKFSNNDNSVNSIDTIDKGKKGNTIKSKNTIVTNNSSSNNNNNIVSTQRVKMLNVCGVLVLL